MHGDKASWPTTDYLLAATVDALNAANWQRGGGKGKRPKPVPRPGDTPKHERRFGTGKLTIGQAREFFDRINRRTEPASVPQVRMCTDRTCGRSDVKARGLCPRHYQRWWRATRAGTSSRR